MTSGGRRTAHRTHVLRVVAVVARSSFTQARTAVVFHSPHSACSRSRVHCTAMPPLATVAATDSSAVATPLAALCPPSSEVRLVHSQAYQHQPHTRPVALPRPVPHPLARHPRHGAAQDWARQGSAGETQSTHNTHQQTHCNATRQHDTSGLQQTDRHGTRRAAAG